MADAYRTDLTYIHDAAYGKFAEHAAPVLSRRLQRAGFSKGLVVDLGCGSGILAEPIAAAGFDVAGYDISPAMIALARKRVPGGRFFEASFVDLAVPPCVAVAAIGEVVNYCFDAGNSDEVLKSLFHNVYDALRPGGLFLFDFAEPGRIPPAGRQHCRAGDDWAVLAEAHEDRRRRLLTRRITAFRKVGDLYRRSEETHTQRLLRRGDVGRWLRRAGLRAQRLAGYGALKLPAGWTVMLARKPR